MIEEQLSYNIEKGEKYITMKYIKGIPTIFP